MTRSDRYRLEDALAHFHAATAYAAGDPAPDQKTIDAICMRLAAGLDSLNTLSPSDRTRLFGDDWALMWGMRNRIAHTYATVEAAVVLATLASDVPVICQRIRTELGD